MQACGQQLETSHDAQYSRGGPRKFADCLQVAEQLLY